MAVFMTSIYRYDVIVSSRLVDSRLHRKRASNAQAKLRGLSEKEASCQLQAVVRPRLNKKCRINRPSLRASARSGPQPGGYHLLSLNQGTSPPHRDPAQPHCSPQQTSLYIFREHLPGNRIPPASQIPLLSS